MHAENQKKSSLKIVVMASELFEEKLNLENQEKIIDKYTALIDGNGLGSVFGSKNKDQETDIFIGSVMEWSIALSNDKEKEDYSVVLDSIKQGNSGFFTKIYKEQNKIIGLVTTDPNYDGKEENYTINFHITKGRESTIILPIDPKLQIRKKT